MRTPNAASRSTVAQRALSIARHEGVQVLSPNLANGRCGSAGLVFGVEHKSQRRRDQPDTSTLIVNNGRAVVVPVVEATLLGRGHDHRIVETILSRP
jgi:hypothetical protein